MGNYTSLPPKWVFYSLKGLITVATVMMLALLVYNWRTHKEKIKSGILMILLYIIMFTALIMTLAYVWIDDQLLCLDFIKKVGNSDFLAEQFVVTILV